MKARICLASIPPQKVWPLDLKLRSVWVIVCRCKFGVKFFYFFGLKFRYVGNANNVQENNGFQSKEESRDNRELVDDNKAQSLTGEDIDAMRR